MLGEIFMDQYKKWMIVSFFVGALSVIIAMLVTKLIFGDYIPYENHFLLLLYTITIVCIIGTITGLFFRILIQKGKLVSS